MATFFKIPFAQEITAKELGAKWNQHVRCWYAPDKKTAGWLLEAGFKAIPTPWPELAVRRIDHVRLS